MEIYQADEQAGKITVLLDFDEMAKIIVEATRTRRLIINVVRDVLTWGIEQYPYTEKKKARY